MADLYKVGRGSTYQEFLKVFEKGRYTVEDNGKYIEKAIDVQTYDEESIKSKFELFREIHHGDAELIRDPHTSQLTRSVRNVAVVIKDESRRLRWYEESRLYASEKKVLNPLFLTSVKPEEFFAALIRMKSSLGLRAADWTYRESLEPGEQPRAGALKGALQELATIWERINYRPSLQDFIIWKRDFTEDLHVSIRGNNGVKGEDRPYVDLEYRSSAFLGINTHSQMFRYELLLPRFVEEGDRFSIIDTGGKPRTATNWVKIDFRALPYT